MSFILPGIDLGGLFLADSPLCSLCSWVEGLKVRQPLAEPSLPLLTGENLSNDFCSLPKIANTKLDGIFG